MDGHATGRCSLLIGRGRAPTCRDRIPPLNPTTHGGHGGAPHRLERGLLDDLFRFATTEWDHQFRDECDQRSTHDAEENT